MGTGEYLSYPVLQSERGDDKIALTCRYAWGQQPAAFLASWNMVSAAVHAQAPQTCKALLLAFLPDSGLIGNKSDMLWSPNSMFAFNNETSNPIVRSSRCLTRFMY